MDFKLAISLQKKFLDIKSSVMDLYHSKEEKIFQKPRKDFSTCPK